MDTKPTDSGIPAGDTPPTIVGNENPPTHSFVDASRERANRQIKKGLTDEQQIPFDKLIPEPFPGPATSLAPREGE